MKGLKRKTVYWLTGLVVLGLAAACFWWSYMTVHEPLRDKSQYPRELDTIRRTRSALQSQKPDLKKAKQLFVKQITERIFPYWYGTAWNFNGTTQKPQEGSIACGYFVTTTLLHMGVKIDRVKMARCASEEMIRSLTSKAHIFHLPGLTLPAFEKKMISLGAGLYIIGLDNHTGYVLISDKGNYFIHASGWFPFKVVKTPLREADVIGRSKYRVVGKISDDEAFLKKWITAKD